MAELEQQDSSLGEKPAVPEMAVLSTGMWSEWFPGVMRLTQ